MSTHKNLDKICCFVTAFVVLITILFMNYEVFGIEKTQQIKKYETTLFDTSKVHTINIIMDDWDELLATANEKTYFNANLEIDGEKIYNVGVRTKGNSSLSMVNSSTSDRYSLKIEFDHYDNTNLFDGLDKMTLNNIIQDNTYMKEYLAYNLMRETGVASPLCSYTQVQINGEDFGLYIAVEAIEESFMERNYGYNYGSLYKPEISGGNNQGQIRPDMGGDFGGQMPNENFGGNNQGQMRPNIGGGMMGNTGSVTLSYIDDNYDSYSYIFDNAVIDITNNDKDAIINALENISENVDVEQTINYFVAHNFLLNFDSYTGAIMHNYYLYEYNGLLTMLPWDYNLSFASFQTSYTSTQLANFPIDNPVSSNPVESLPMLSWIFENEIYTQMYHDKFENLITEFFDSGKFKLLIENAYTLISPYVQADSTKFCTYEDFQIGVDTLIEFCNLRVESIKSQLSGENLTIDASHVDISLTGSERGTTKFR